MLWPSLPYIFYFFKKKNYFSCAESCGLSLDTVSGVYSLLMVCRLLILVASLFVEHELQGLRSSVVVTYGLSSCSSRAQANSRGARA